MKILFTLTKSILTTFFLIIGYLFLIFLFEKDFFELNLVNWKLTFWIVSILFFIPSFLSNYWTDFPDLDLTEDERLKIRKKFIETGE